MPEPPLGVILISATSTVTPIISNNLFLENKISDFGSEVRSDMVHEVVQRNIPNVLWLIQRETLYEILETIVRYYF